jgi:hypothetical protein
MDLAQEDWRRLERLRARFLALEERQAGTGEPDYWRDRRDLELYDQAFGARIAWKWKAVVDELVERGLEPPAGALLDWGCGTGRAARAWLTGFGSRSAAVVRLWDRSAMARELAAERVRAELGAEAVAVSGIGTREAPAVLLVSHVLAELDPPSLAGLLALARRSRLVAWVEPGSRAVSRRLSAVRDALLDELEVLAPCTHGAACGALAAGHEGDWCHAFARPAPEAFTSRFWRRLGERLGVDLRSLPYAWLVMRARALGPAQRVAGAARVLGRPRMQKGHAQVQACDANGLSELRLLERDARDEVRRLGHPAGERLVYTWRVERGRIRDPRPRTEVDLSPRPLLEP